MKIFEYDINSGDKGIIVAETEERAVELLKEEYPDADLNDYWGYNGALIAHVTDLDGNEQLVCTWNA